MLIGSLFSIQLLWAQNKTVIGKITDSKDGSPVIGASVSVKGSKLGTVSGQDGTFSLSVPEKTTTLLISGVGFQSKEVVISGSSVQVSLVAGESQNLQEVIVTGYGTKAKKDLTGSIARVKGTEVANMPVPNFNQALQGRAAGVFVEANNGKVGEGVKVRIRGTGSISAANDPLYVVDGVPINTISISSRFQY